MVISCTALQDDNVVEIGSYSHANLIIEKGLAAKGNGS